MISIKNRYKNGNRIEISLNNYFDYISYMQFKSSDKSRE